MGHRVKRDVRDERSGETRQSIEHRAWSMGKKQRSEAGGQRAASQIVNLSTSQMVINGLNDESTSQPFDDLTN
jgi:hypothetical protein